MKNQYIPKKFKLIIILNALYQRNSTFTRYSATKMLEHVGKVFLPSCQATKFKALYVLYSQIEDNIMNIYDGWTARPSDIADYANKHNITLYSREYLRL